MANIRTHSRSFIGGEVTPEFFGMIADVKYQTGLKTCRNFIILPHGPVANRPGTKFVKEVKYSGKRTRLIDFTYSTDQTFAIEMGEGYFRFHTQGLTLQAGTPSAYAGGTPYVIGDLVLSGGVNYYCVGDTTGNAPPNATYWYAMPSDGTYEIPNNFLEGEVFEVHFVQSQDILTLTHTGHPPTELRRLGATTWVLADIGFTSDLGEPTGVTVTNSPGTGSTTYRYKVTSVDATGKEESLSSTEGVVTNAGTVLSSTDKNTVTWTAGAGAIRYNVYKQDNGLYGYIGQTDVLTFLDDGIDADISQTAPIEVDPFTSTDNYPQAVSYYEQRRDFAGTNNNPSDIWMTRRGAESNMSYSIPTRDSDGISFRIAARQANTIRHLIPLIDLIVLSSSAVWMVTSVNSDSITPDSIAVKPQSYIGASNVQPSLVNNSILYDAARGGHRRELRYAAESGGYSSRDLSLRAPHLFNHLTTIDMAYSEAPYSFNYSVSSNGVLLGLTYVPEEDISSWHWHDTYTNAGDLNDRTRSLFKSCAVVAEGIEDYLYVIVEREINGSTVQYVERMASRNFNAIQDGYFVDCGASYNDPKVITGITKADPGVATSNAHGFSNNDKLDFTEVEGMIEVNGQRYYAANVTANTFELVDEFGVNVDTTGFTTYESGGEVRNAIDTISSGLSHIEGETVSILVDGAVQPPQTVTGGSVTWDEAGGVVQIGLPIEADIETLPLAFEVEAFGQGRKKNVNQLWLRVHESSGIFAGPDFNNLTEKKQRTTEPYGSPPSLKSAELQITIGPKWGDSGSVAIRQSDPLPLTLVSMTLEVSVGA